MKKHNNNDFKFAIIALGVFLLFLIAVSVLGSLIQATTIPNFTEKQGVQGLIAFVILAPLCVATYYAGKYFKKMSGSICSIFTMLSMALLVFAILLVIISACGVSFITVN